LKGEKRAEERPVTALSPRQKPASDAQARVAALYRQHADRVYRAAWRVTGNDADAEDVLQNVFLRVMRQEDGAIDEAQAGSYLHRAAVNAAVDLLRRRKAARSEALEPREATLRDPDPGPAAATEMDELKARVRAALTGLNPRAAEMVVLRYFEGYGNREIAAMLGTSWSTVAVTLHRAKARLRSGLLGDLA
jgi:RNA polymerase sigma-70 factor (ECF subfamily)